AGLAAHHRVPGNHAYRAINWLPVQVPVLSRSNLYFSFWYLAAPRLYAAVRYLERSYYKAAIRHGDTGKRRLSDEDLLERKVQMWRRYAR
ncbi:MAG: hypothetical protein ACREQK_19570, partial [Candidatus Binatia bacterium]